MNIKKVFSWAKFLIAVFVAVTFQSHILEAKETAVDKTNINDKKAAQEILWLARAVQSETNREHEMALIAWTIRHRVESGHRGADTYKEVVLDRHQFSGLNNYDNRYSENISYDYEDNNPVWKKALAVSEAVYYAPEWLSPIPKTTKHFYSPLAVGYTPEWAKDRAPIYTVLDSKTDKIRFAFYDSIK